MQGSTVYERAWSVSALRVTEPGPGDGCSGNISSVSSGLPAVEWGARLRWPVRLRAAHVETLLFSLRGRRPARTEDVTG